MLLLHAMRNADSTYTGDTTRGSSMVAEESRSKLGAGGGGLRLQGGLRVTYLLAHACVEEAAALVPVR
jgi:hypothetical protein